MKIAISGLSCVGTTSTATALSQLLSIPLSTFTLKDLARERGVEFDLIHNELKKENAKLDYELDRQQITHLLTHKDAIVASDLACWLDDPRVYETLGLKRGPVYDLKIWLAAKESERAKRFAKREGGTLEQLREYDKQNRNHYLALYGIDIFDHSDIDWVFMTNDLRLDEVADKIAERVKLLTR